MSWEDSNMWRDMKRMHRRMDKMFKQFWDRPFKVDSEFEEYGAPSDYRKALTDFEETDTEFVLRVELPGMKKEDIALDITDVGLEIKAERKEESNNENSSHKSFAGFYQRIALPDNADLDNIEAKYGEGVLTIHVAKIPSADKRRGVTIK